MNAGEDVRRDIRDCLRRGDVAGAIRGYLQLVDEQPEDWASVNALGDLYLRQGDVDNAVVQFLKVADFYSAEGFLPRAAALYRKILKNKYDDLAMLSLIDVVARQGHLGEAKEYLIELERTRRASGDVAGADECLESLERFAEVQGAMPVLTVLDEASLEIAPPEADPTDEELAALIEGDAAVVDTMVVETLTLDTPPDDVLVDGAPLEGSLLEPGLPADAAVPRAAQAVTPQAPAVEDASIVLPVDELNPDSGRSPESGFADPLAGSLGAPASFDTPADFDLGPPTMGASGGGLSFDDLSGGLKPATAPGDLPSGLSPFEPVDSPPVDDLGLDMPGAGPADASAAPLTPTTPRAPLARRKKPGAGRKPQTGAKRAAPLQSIFDQMRQAAEKEQDSAHERFDLAQYHLRDGREDEAMAQLVLAAQSPVVRFKAAAQLGRLYLWRGDLPAAIEWLERAGEVPPVSPDEGHAVLYELADALEQQGETARALAVLMELEAQRRSYRDVPRRIARLSASSEPGSSTP